MITVLLVEDQDAARKSLRYLLESTEDIKVVGTAVNAAEAIARVGPRCPDVAIIDISKPLTDWLDVTQQFHGHCPSTRIIMLSFFAQPEHVQRALDAGASGYVLKESIRQDLIEGIRALHRGRRYFSSTVAAFANRYLESKHNDSWAG